MWSRLCYTYIYVHATPSITEASLSLYAAVKTNLPHKPGESSMQCESCHFQKNMLDPNPKIFDLDHLLLHPPSEIPCHNAQRKFAMDAWKGWNQRSWNHPIHGHCMSNPQARKSSQNILSFQRTWKRHGRRLNFAIFLTTWILPCETVHDIFTNIHRWACPARGSLYHIDPYIDSSLTAQCRLQSTGRGASCWQLHLSLPHPPTSCSMGLVLARDFSDFVWITSLCCPQYHLRNLLSLWWSIRLIKFRSAQECWAS